MAKRKGICDIVLLVDATGSMGPCIDALKRNIKALFQMIEHDPQMPIKDWRAKVVGYRDYDDNQERWLDDNDFVNNDISSLEMQIDGLEVFGGGDEPEGLIDAFAYILDMKHNKEVFEHADMWRDKVAKIIVHFTDATCHKLGQHPTYRNKTLAEMLGKMTSDNITLISYSPDDSCYDQFDEEENIIWSPIAKDPDFKEGLKKFTSDHTNFQKVIEILGKTILGSVKAAIL